MSKFAAVRLRPTVSDVVWRYGFAVNVFKETAVRLGQEILHSAYTSSLAVFTNNQSVVRDVG